jgi:hypothetical protein
LAACLGRKKRGLAERGAFDQQVIVGKEHLLEHQFAIVHETAAASPLRAATKRAAPDSTPMRRSVRRPPMTATQKLNSTAIPLKLRLRQAE